jgi:phage tail-like protein
MSDFALHQGNFLVEIDGVTALEATECTGGDLKHEPVEMSVGTREKPIYGRGKSKIEPVKLKHAKALNNSGAEIYQWFNDFHRGIAVDRRNLRVIQLDEQNTPVESTDYIDCIPTNFTPVDHKADGKDAAYFSAEFQPSDIDYAA